MNDTKEFFEGLKESTQIVDNNINLTPDESDFMDMPEGTDIPDDTPFENPTEENDIPVSSLVDPDETADICIDMIDGVQAPIFMLLHRRKLVSKYFKEKENYKIASEIYALDDADIETNYPDNVESYVKLKRKYKAMLADYTAKTVDVPLSEDERTRLKNPMRRMVERSGFDVPPAMALCICMGQIMINRIIDVYWD